MAQRVGTGPGLQGDVTLCATLHTVSLCSLRTRGDTGRDGTLSLHCALHLCASAPLWPAGRLQDAPPARTVCAQEMSYRFSHQKRSGLVTNFVPSTRPLCPDVSVALPRAETKNLV